jgi:predicted acetyltransferase
VRYQPGDSGCKVSVVAGEQTVADLQVLRLTMQLRGAPVQMAGIADVRTHPAHRRQGHARRLFAGTLAYLRRERYPLSLLFGISDFYWRFGYTPVLPEYDVSLTTREAERLGPGDATVRPARPEDGPALLRLYSLANRDRTGTLRRTAETFDPLPRQDVENWWFHPRRILVAEVGGRPAGYVALSGDPSSFRVRELIVPAEDVATAGAGLIAALASEAVARRLERIRLPLPPDEPLLGLLRPVGCKVEVTYPANEDGMGRIVDLAALAEALTPALAPRVAALPAPERPGALELVALADPVAQEPEAQALLRWDPGRAVSVALPPQALCQLLMGYRGLDELRLHHPDAVAPEDLTAVGALFPAGYPHMWAIDHF